MNEFLSKIGIDKVLHFSVGGFISALITLVVIIQDVSNLSMGMMIATPLLGTVCVGILSLFKELIDSEFNWKDILAGILGTIPTYLAVAVGVLFNVLAK